MRLQIVCSGCGILTYNRGHGLCKLCYSRYIHIISKDRIEENRKKRWPEYYIKSKKRVKAYSFSYRRRDYVKKKKQEYDRMRRDQIRFNGNRKIILDKVNNKCEICGTSENLHVHHKDGHSYWNGIPNNDLDNLMVVCENCHYSKIHSERPPFSLSRKNKISQAKIEYYKKLRIIREQNEQNNIRDGQERTCSLCGKISHKNSVISQIFINDDYSFDKKYRMPYYLTLEEIQMLGPGKHFICKKINRCKKRFLDLYPGDRPQTEGESAGIK